MNQFTSTNNPLSNMNFEKLFTLNNYSPDVKKHLINVYLSLVACLIFTAFGVFTTLYFHLSLGSMMTFFASMAMVLWIQMDSNKTNLTKRLGMLCGFGFLQGLSLAPLISLAIQIDPTIILTAVLGTLTIFLCFSGAAMTSQRRSYLFLGGFLSSAASLLLVLSLVNIFYQSMNLYSIQLYGGLMMFSGYVIFDTQLILEKAESGSRDAIGHALELFLDFIAILVRLIVILLKNAEKKNNDNNRRKNNNHR
jgi:Bax inhibitor 1